MKTDSLAPFKRQYLRLCRQKNYPITIYYNNPILGWGRGAKMSYPHNFFE